MNLDRFRRKWFKFSIKIYGNKEYVVSCSSYFDMNIFQRQNFACEYYRFFNHWIIGTGNELSDKLVKVWSNIDNLKETYTKISEIIDELLGSCYFNKIGNLLDTISVKAILLDMQVNNFCKNVLKETTKFKDILMDCNKNINKFSYKIVFLSHQKILKKFTLVSHVSPWLTLLWICLKK